MGEPSVLRQLRGAAGVGDADPRGHDNVRGTGIHGWVVIVERDRRAVENLPQAEQGLVQSPSILAAASASEEFVSQSSETSSSAGPMPLGLAGDSDHGM